MKRDEKVARQLVTLRASGISGGPMCEGCLMERATDWAHRLHRSRGGLWCATNGLAFGRTCHSWQHAHPIEAEQRGWTVPSGTDPAVVPVWTSRWGLVYLLANGDYQMAARPRTGRNPLTVERAG